MTSKADKLRAAGRDAGEDGLCAADIKKIAGHQANISPMVKTGEFVIKDTPDGKRYVLNRDFKAHQKAARELPIKRKSKKKTPKHRALKSAPQTPAPLSLTDIALDDLMAAGRHLMTAIRERVDGLDTDPVLSEAVDRFDRSQRMADAVRA